MPEYFPITDQYYQISFADGQTWHFHPTDFESSEIISHLAQIMRLSHGKSGKELFVSTKNKRFDQIQVPGQGNPAICILPPGINDALQTIQLMDLARSLALQLLPHGGVLIHGALIERNGDGVILAARGGTGKTTASSRVMPPWRQLSDDATLVVRTGTGECYAHPWPTWSRFFENGPGGNWDVEKVVRLRGFFFLNRAGENSVTPMEIAETTACLMESVTQMMHFVHQKHEEKSKIEDLYQMELNAVQALAGIIPSYILNISLTGPFWEKIDEVIINEKSKPVSFHVPLSQEEGSVTHDTTEPSFFGDKSVPIVYTGPSMNPTLSEPDLLKVIPYSQVKGSVGDVICYFSPEKNYNIVHRIVRITNGGYITQGDNNLQADSKIVKPEFVIGKVAYACRAQRIRVIAGGGRGYTIFIVHQYLKKARIVLMRVLRIIMPVLMTLKKVLRLASVEIKPRIIIFSNRQRKYGKLFFKDILIGEYNLKINNWSIRFFYTLFIDHRKLPKIRNQEMEQWKNRIRTLDD